MIVVAVVVVVLAKGEESDKGERRVLLDDVNIVLVSRKKKNYIRTKFK